MIFNLEYFYHASGMEYADIEDLGEFEAESLTEAIQQAVSRIAPIEFVEKIPFRYRDENGNLIESVSSRSNWDFLRSCIRLKQ